MTRNTLMDLNNALFEQMERLNSDDVDLEKEVIRTKAMESVSRNIIDNARVVLEAQRLKDDHMNADLKLPRLLSVPND